jgi:hypothetical protein
MKRERERGRERFEIITYFVKSTTVVDTGCYESVVKAKERESKGGLKYIYLLGEIYKICRYWVLCVSSKSKGEREQGRFEIYT